MGTVKGVFLMNKKIFNFPSIDFWRENVLIATEQKRFFKNHYYEYYLQKYIIASLYRPRKIAEIGVRWGYSAFSFLCASPQAIYSGFDIPDGKHGGAGVDTYMYVDKMLKKHFPTAEIILNYQDTQKLKEMPGKYDFIHVDGCHEENATFHDLEISWKALAPGGVLLLDDDTKLPSVRKAAQSFIKQKYSLFEYYYRMPSLTGEVIIRKPSP